MNWNHLTCRDARNQSTERRWDRQPHRWRRWRRPCVVSAALTSFQLTAADEASWWTRAHHWESAVMHHCSRSRCRRRRRHESRHDDVGRSSSGRLYRRKNTRMVSGRCELASAFLNWSADWNCGRIQGTCEAILPGEGFCVRPTSAIDRNLCRSRRIWTVSPSSGCNCKKKNKQYISIMLTWAFQNCITWTDGYYFDWKN